MQTSFFKRMMEPSYYTAVVDHNGDGGIVRSSSLRQAMRAASRFNTVQPPDAQISVYRHINGHDPKLVAKRRVIDRFWKYAEKYQ